MTIYAYIITMAVTTYLIRVLPLTVFRKSIKSRFVKSFLHYVPYACLTAMTFPAISGIAALVVAVVLAFRGKSLLTVALASCATVFVSERLLCLFF